MNNNTVNLPESAKKVLQQNRAISSLVADAIREAVFSGLLRASQPLRQEEIATQLGVSRMPVREALRQLEGEGLITMYPHRGAVVSQLSAEELEELTDIRIALETLALRLAIPRVTERDLQRAEEILATAENDPDVTTHWSQHNWQFHSALYLPAGRPRLLAMIKTLHTSAARYLSMQVFMLHYSEQGHQEHREFLEACKRRDTSAAVELLEQHLANVRYLLLPHLLRASGEDTIASTGEHPSTGSGELLVRTLGVNPSHQTTDAVNTACLDNRRFQTQREAHIPGWNATVSGCRHRQ